MKHFTNTTNKTFSFSSCEICEAKCCNGKEGTVYAQIILEDFKEVYKNFPILFIFGDLGYLKPVLLLTNGKDFCKYLQDFKCSIYEHRPSICKNYPLSPNLDNNTYIDELCPAVKEEKTDNFIVKNNTINQNYIHNTLINYQEKYINTYFEFESFNKKEDFTLAIRIKGIEFFRYTKESENPYMKMHQDSLVHLQDTYFI